MKKRVFSILLCIVVCMAMMPLGVYGAAGSITVGGKEITINTVEDGKDVYELTENITTKDGGYVKYNAEKRVLTIKDAEVNGKIEFGDSQSYTIIVEGDSSINVTGDAGITSLGKLTVKGGGKLTVTGSKGINSGTGTYGGTLTFENVEVVATGNSNHGIYCGKGDIEIVNSKITAQGAENFRGIKPNDGNIIAKDAVDENGKAISANTNGVIGNYYDGTIDNKIVKYIDFEHIIKIFFVFLHHVV